MRGRPPAFEPPAAARSACGAGPSPSYTLGRGMARARHGEPPGIAQPQMYEYDANEGTNYNPWSRGLRQARKARQLATRHKVMDQLRAQKQRINVLQAQLSEWQE